MIPLGQPPSLDGETPECCSRAGHASSDQRWSWWCTRRQRSAAALKYRASLDRSDHGMHRAARLRPRGLDFFGLAAGWSPKLDPWGQALLPVLAAATSMPVDLMQVEARLSFASRWLIRASGGHHGHPYAERIIAPRAILSCPMPTGSLK